MEGGGAVEAHKVKRKALTALERFLNLKTSKCKGCCNMNKIILYNPTTDQGGPLKKDYAFHNPLTEPLCASYLDDVYDPLAVRSATITV